MNIMNVERKYTKSNRGNALIIVSAISLAIGVAVMALQSYIPSLTSQSLKSTDVVNYKLALDSAVDYAAIAIKKRWCLGDAMLPQSPCNITNPRNTQRLMLNSEAKRYIFSIKDSLPAETNPSVTSDVFNSPSDIGIEEIVISIDPRESLTDIHPLAGVLKNLPNGVTELKWTIGTLNSIYTPSTGDQTFITIKAELTVTGENSARSILGGSTLFTEALFTYYKRELGTMALIVANDMHLDEGSYKSSVLNEDAGNAYIPYLNKTGNIGKGLVFKSPVFVNGNVYLPSATDDNAFSNVTFANKLYLGNGGIFRDDLPYAPPRDTSGELATYGNMPFMGGFKGGVVKDGERDKGLDYFVNAFSSTSYCLKNGAVEPYGDPVAGNPKFELCQAPTPVAATDMQLCIERSEALMDLTATNESSLVVKNMGATPPGPEREYRFRLGLTKGNEFLQQSGGQLNANVTKQGAWRDPNNTSQPLTNPISIQFDGNTYPVANVTIKLDDPTKNGTPGNEDPSFKAQMPSGSTVTAVPDISDMLDREVQNAQDAITQLDQQNGKTKAQLELELLTANNDVGPARTTRDNAKTNLETVMTANAENGTADISPDMRCNNIRPIDNGQPGQAQKDLMEAACIPYVAAEDALAPIEAVINTLPNKIAQYDALEAAKQTIIDTKDDYIANPPEITVSLEPTLVEGDSQPNQLDLVVKTKNEGGLPSLFTIEVLGYEVGTDLNGNSTRDLDVPAGSYPKHGPGEIRSFHAEVILQNTGLGSNFNVENSFPSPGSSGYGDGWRIGDKRTNSIVGPIADGYNYAEIIEKCNTLGGSGGEAFGVPGWEDSFSPSTRKSWIFANPQPADISDTVWFEPPITQTLNIQDSIDDLTGNSDQARYNKFQINSIVEKCRIRANKKFIAGFFMCDSLDIESRTQPLVIIGSIIAGHLRVHPEAVKAGVSFYSIYHPEAIQMLRENNILYPANGSNGTNCFFPARPVWHPKPAFNDLANTLQCSPISLRARADNWTWTQVDPEQGFGPDPVTGALEPQRKPISKRFIIKEVSRASNL